MLPAQSNEATVERVIVGEKGFRCESKDPETGETVRRRALKGEKVQVTRAQARAFKHYLADPKVLKAKARAAAEEEEEDEDKDPKVSGSGSPGSGTPGGGSGPSSGGPGKGPTK